MKIIHHIINLTTNATLDFINITEKIKKLVDKHGIKEGIINVQSMHTTMAVIIQEAEPLLIGDLKKILEKVAPRTLKYMHDNFDIRTVNMHPNEPKNGHSHCKAAFLTNGVFLNIVKSRLHLGKWQNIFAVELDDSRERQISVQIIGK